MFDAKKIREDFPIFNSNKNLIYFDNASTTQKPKIVLDALQKFYSQYNANVHRGIYTIAVEATNEYEKSRKKIARFINCKTEEVIWTRGATEAINQVLYGWALWNLKKGDEIVTTIMEHHSNIVPWQLLQKNGVKIRYVSLNDDGKLNMEEFENFVNKKTKFVTVTHMSNVLGTINPIEEIVKIAHDNNAFCLIDAAQSAPHMQIDVKKIDCDFLVFSGHKMLGPTGVGVLYAKEEILENLDPPLRGSEQIKSVSLFESEWNDLPWKFEPGTPNFADIIAFGYAVDYLNKLGMENVHDYENDLTKYALEKLQQVSKLKIFGPTKGERGAVISFQLGDINSHDMASFLSDNNIAVRSGHHCAMPLMKYLGVSGTTRASFYIYNTKDEVDKFVDVLEKAKKVFKL